MPNIQLLNLPLDALLNILKWLELKDLQKVMLSCKTLKSLILNNSSIWRNLALKRLTVRGSTYNWAKTTAQWYNLHRTSVNWCRGIYRSKIQINFDTKYMPWLNFYESKALLLTVGSDLFCYNIKKYPRTKEVLWQLAVPTIVRSDVRTCDITRFVVKDGNIICGNRDGCVAIYRYNGDIQKKPYLCCHIQDCHQNGNLEVTDVDLITKIPYHVLTVSDKEPTLKYWYYTMPDIRSESPYDICETSTLGGLIHLPNCLGAKCLDVNLTVNKVAVGPNGNSRPMLIDIATKYSLLEVKTPLNPALAIRDVVWHNDKTIGYVTHSGKLQFIDIRSRELIYDAMDPFQSTIYCLKTDKENAIIIGTAEYSRCVLFDARNAKRHVQMYFTQKKASPVYSLDFDSHKLITAADRSVAVLNFNVDQASNERRDYSHTFELIDR